MKTKPIDMKALIYRTSDWHNPVDAPILSAKCERKNDNFEDNVYTIEVEKAIDFLDVLKSASHHIVLKEPGVTAREFGCIMEIEIYDDYRE